jgi:ketosteroid isomerase-like protein
MNAPGTAPQFRATRAAAHLRSLVVLALLLAPHFGCSGSEVEVRGEAPSLTGETTRSSSNLLTGVMEADRAFARSVAEQGLEAWVAAFSDDGSMIPASGPVTSGHEAIRAAMAPAFATPGFSIVWEPLGGEVAGSGDLGYTYGDYESGVEGALTRGRYVTVWRRSSDGKWKVIADLGNREQSPE